MRIASPPDKGELQVPLARKLIRQLAHLLVDISIQALHLAVCLRPIPTDIEFLNAHDAP